MGLPAKCTFCGVPGKEGVQYFHVKCRKVYLIPPPLYGGEI